MNAPSKPLLPANITIYHFVLCSGSALSTQTYTIAQFRQSLTPTYTTISPTPNTDITQAYLSSSSCPFDTNPTEGTQAH